jgi:hypothetical protein
MSLGLISAIQRGIRAGLQKKGEGPRSPDSRRNDAEPKGAGAPSRMRRFQLARGIVQEMNGKAGGFLFNSETGHAYVLNPSGAFVLEKLLKDDPPRKVAEDLAARYCVEPSRALSDVMGFLDAMVEQNLLVTHV